MGAARGMIGQDDCRRSLIKGGRVPATGLLLLSVVLWGCSSSKPPAPATTEVIIPVALAAALAAGVGSSLDVSGTVRLKRETPLAFNTGGRVAEIAVREGDTVARGAMLARLDPTSLAAAANSARAEAGRADADFRRLSGLFAKGWITAPRVETARATAAAAHARVQQADFDVGLSTIHAPSQGVVLRRQAEPGQMTTPGQVILVLGEIASGYVLQLPLSDVDLGRVRIGQPAFVTITALGDLPIAARVSEIGARGDNATGTFRVEVALPSHVGLRSGLIGSARLRFGGPSMGGAVTVPSAAVFSARADEGFVYVHDAASGRVSLRQVALGPLGDTLLTITGGLQPGEMVVTSGPDRLRDGVRVAAKVAPRA
jgi:RND family efflux transporter MFP subunit